MRTVRLRLATLADAPALAEMSRELIETGLSWRYTARRMTALMLGRDNVVLVADEAAVPSGFAVMQFGDEQAHLSLLCVQPAQQRSGLGRRLHAWLLASAGVAGIAHIDLELRADNPGAHAFYRSLGYLDTQRVPGYYDGRLAAQRMRLTLRQEARST